MVVLVRWPYWLVAVAVCFTMGGCVPENRSQQLLRIREFEAIQRDLIEKLPILLASTSIPMEMVKAKVDPDSLRYQVFRSPMLCPKWSAFSEFYLKGSRVYWGWQFFRGRWELYELMIEGLPESVCWRKGELSGDCFANPYGEALATLINQTLCDIPPPSQVNDSPETVVEMEEHFPDVNRSDPFCEFSDFGLVEFFRMFHLYNTPDAEKDREKYIKIWSELKSESRQAQSMCEEVDFVASAYRRPVSPEERYQLDLLFEIKSEIRENYYVGVLFRSDDSLQNGGQTTSWAFKPALATSEWFYQATEIDGKRYYLVTRSVVARDIPYEVLLLFYHVDSQGRMTERHGRQISLGWQWDFGCNPIESSNNY